MRGKLLSELNFHFAYPDLCSMRSQLRARERFPQCVIGTVRAKQERLQEVTGVSTDLYNALPALFIPYGVGAGVMLGRCLPLAWCCIPRGV